MDAARYNRIPEAFLDIQGPSYQWKHGVIPGMGVKPPTLAFPVEPHKDSKDPKCVTAELADLRALHAQNR